MASTDSGSASSTLPVGSRVVGRHVERSGVGQVSRGGGVPVSNPVLHGEVPGLPVDDGGPGDGAEEEEDGGDEAGDDGLVGPAGDTDLVSLARDETAGRVGLRYRLPALVHPEHLPQLHLAHLLPVLPVLVPLHLSPPAAEAVVPARGSVTVGWATAGLTGPHRGLEDEEVRLGDLEGVEVRLQAVVRPEDRNDRAGADNSSSYLESPRAGKT